MKQFKALLTSPAFLIGTSLFVLCLFLSIAYPLITSTDPFARVGYPFEQPSLKYWLGTNAEGQDMLAQILFGLRASMFVGITAGLIATILGTLIGITGGYSGGLLDNILTMATNLLLVIPSLIILILITTSIEKRSLVLVALIIGATTWTWTARAVRAQAASLKNREHVHLAKLNGAGTLSILILQILPYMLSYVFMAFVMQMATGILSEAAISMLGLGPYDTVTLGQILHYAQRTEALINGNWWAFLPATIMVTVIAFSLYLVNTAMEGIFNPRLRK
ncbi:MAG: ABC transporter permease subunit [Chitinivibrionales bacterium]|nr:ABC transporter permease subunit [Chitinivibrionales bacterium]